MQTPPSPPPQKKILFGDERGVKPRGDVTSIPKNLAGSRPTEEIREGKMPIKGEVATKGMGKCEEENLKEKL